MGHRVVWLETGQSFEVQPGETVLDAALRCAAPLPHECTFGGCGTCRVRLIEGQVAYEEFPLALSEAEAQQGFALACQARPLADLVVSVVQPGASSSPMVLEATVESVQPLGTDVLHLRLRLPEGTELLYQPGQYMNVLLGDGRHRSFSMASRPEGLRVDFHVRRIRGGRFTDARLAALSPGDRLPVEIPLGSFRYHREDDRPLLMMATGTGLAPIKSMLESLMDNDDCPPVSLYWGARTPADLYLHDEIAAWAERLYEFRYVPVLSRAGDDWRGRRGHVQQAVLEDAGTELPEHSIYLCGSPAMVRDAQASLAAQGADPARVYADSFLFQPD